MIFLFINDSISMFERHLPSGPGKCQGNAIEEVEHDGTDGLLKAVDAVANEVLGNADQLNRVDKMDAKVNPFFFWRRLYS